jgi:hypothetical protein
VELVPAVFVFGFLGNLCNISINTQAVGVESLYGRSIMATFHGLWSLAGFCGAAIGTFMVSENILPFWHFLVICIALIALVVSSQRFALAKDATHPDQKLFAKPDKMLLDAWIDCFQLHGL